MKKDGIGLLIRLLIINTIFNGLLLSFTKAAGTTQSLTYQGRIIRNDGIPLQNSNISFLFQIMDPSGACLIYQEQVNNISMANSNGIFDIPIGDGTIQYISQGSVVTDTFNNKASHHCGTCSLGSQNTYSCSTSALPPYLPGLNDGRRLRVSFYDGGWRLISPDNLIRAVPYAAFANSAYKLGENTALDFVLKNEINSDGTQSQSCIGPNNFLTWDASTFKFGCEAVSGGGGGLTEVTSANADITVTNSTAAPQLTLNSGLSANQIVKLDGAARLPTSTLPALTGDITTTSGTATTSLTAIKGTPVNITSLGSGNYLKYDGTAWVNATLSVSDLSDASSLITSSQMPANCTAGKTLTFSSPTNSWLCSDIVVIAANFSPQTQGAFLAGPISGSGTPSFRSIASTDLPSSITDGLWAENAGNVSRASGGVGIGTTTPMVALDVYGGVGGNPVTTLTNNSSQAGYSKILYLNSPNLAAGESAVFNIGKAATTNNRGVMLYNHVADGSSANSLSFGLYGNNTILSVTGEKRVGIGTVKPEADLHIRSNRAVAPVALGSESSIILEGTPTDAGSQGFIGSLWFGSREISDTEGTSKAAGILGYMANDVTTTSAPASLLFYTTPPGSLLSSERMRIDPAGNIGIGTATPETKLHIAASNSGHGTGLILSNPDSTPGNSIYINFRSHDNDAMERNFAAIRTTFINHAAGSLEGRLDFLVANTSGNFGNKMSILQNGNVGIGTTGASYNLHVVGDTYTSGYFRSPNGAIQTSDVRFKDNIRFLERALEKILNIRGVTYDWKRAEFPEQRFSDKHQMGVIAQEVETQFPEAVITDTDGYKAVNYSSLIAPLINATKELYAELLERVERTEFNTAIQALKEENAEKDDKIKSLQHKNFELEERLNKIEKSLSAKTPISY